jgi:hypothetical protein
MPRKAREPNWPKSDAKKLLLQDLWSGEIPLNSESMNPRDAFFQRPEFAEFGGYENFSDVACCSVVDM